MILIWKLLKIENLKNQKFATKKRNNFFRFPISDFIKEVYQTRTAFIAILIRYTQPDILSKTPNIYLMESIQKIKR